MVKRTWRQPTASDPKRKVGRPPLGAISRHRSCEWRYRDSRANKRSGTLAGLSHLIYLVATDFVGGGHQDPTESQSDRMVVKPMARITNSMYLNARGFADAVTVANRIVHAIDTDDQQRDAEVLPRGRWSVSGFDVEIEREEADLACLPSSIRADTPATSGDRITLRRLADSHRQDDVGNWLPHQQRAHLTGTPETRRMTTSMLVGAIAHETVHCLTRASRAFSQDTWDAAAAASQKANRTNMPADYAAYVLNDYEAIAHATQIVCMVLLEHGCRELIDVARFERLFRGNWIARYVASWPQQPAQSPARGTLIDRLWSRAPKCRDMVLR